MGALLAGALISSRPQPAGAWPTVSVFPACFLARQRVGRGIGLHGHTYVLRSLSLAPTIVMVSALIFCLSLIRPRA